MRILTMNGGSSSIKFAVFDEGPTLNRTLNRSIQRIGMSETAIEFHDSLNNHRGGRATDAVEVQATIEFLVHLRKISACDPQHTPGEIALTESFSVCNPETTQAARFDTLFHVEMPQLAKMLAISRRLSDMGIHRYGFHGLSFAYLMQELFGLDDIAATKGRVLFAHLGNRASLAAVRDGKSIDTSMGFTPAAGLPMDTRSGDLDRGLVGYLAKYVTY